MYYGSYDLEYCRDWQTRCLPNNILGHASAAIEVLRPINHEHIVINL